MVRNTEKKILQKIGFRQIKRSRLVHLILTLVKVIKLDARWFNLKSQILIVEFFEIGIGRKANDVT